MVTKKSLTLGAILLTGCTQFYYPETPQHDHAGREIKVVYSYEKTQVPIKLLPGEVDDGKKRTRNLIATIEYVNGTPFVYVDPNEASKFSVEGQAFMIQHEIAHLQLNHLHNYSIGITQQEQEADCKAGIYLRDEQNYTPSQMEKVLQDVRRYLNENRYRDLNKCLEEITPKSPQAL